MDFFAANQGKINTFQLKVAHFLNLLFERDGIAVADPGFPVGGRGLPRGLRFENFVCRNVRIRTLGRGERAPGTPPLDPPMDWPL